MYYTGLMQSPRISMIAAVGAHDRALGKNNDLLWRLPEDLKRFKQLTTGHAIIMGRKTYESIGKPLPNRTNIVITRDPSYQAEGCIVVTSLDEAIVNARDVETEEIFIIGGGQIYEQGLEYADRLYLTLIDAPSVGADVFFPDYSAFTKKISGEHGVSGDIHYTWVTLEK